MLKLIHYIEAITSNSILRFKDWETLIIYITSILLLFKSYLVTKMLKRTQPLMEGIKLKITKVKLWSMTKKQQTKLRRLVPHIIYQNHLRQKKRSELFYYHFINIHTTSYMLLILGPEVELKVSVL